MAKEKCMGEGKLRILQESGGGGARVERGRMRGD